MIFERINATGLGLTITRSVVEALEGSEFELTYMTAHEAVEGFPFEMDELDARDPFGRRTVAARRVRN